MMHCTFSNVFMTDFSFMTKTNSIDTKNSRQHNRNPKMAFFLTNIT